MAENPFFRQAINETSKGNVHGYTLPPRRRFAGNLLKESKEDLKADMTKKMKEATPYGYSLSSDGWENIQREPRLMNIMLLTTKGDFFLDSWNVAQADKKDSTYLGKMWLKYIDEIGARHIVQIVTNGAPANQLAEKDVVMDKYPHITWSWCAAHVMDLLLEDMCGNKKIVLDLNGDNPFKKIFIRLRWIVKVVYGSQKLSAIFDRKSPHKKLLNPNTTRFATHFIMAQRALELRAALQHMVIDDKWRSYRDGLPPASPSGGKMSRPKADELKQWIQNDAFWDKVEATVEFGEYTKDTFICMIKTRSYYDDKVYKRHVHMHKPSIHTHSR